MLKKTDILGVGITSTTEDKILEYILNELGKPAKARNKIVIFTPNPEQLSAAYGDTSLKKLLNKADIALPDGIGIVVAGRLLSRPIEARITGVDFMKNLVKSVSEQPVMTGYLGGQGSVAEKTADCLAKMWPNLRIGYASASYDREKMIHSDIDILFVAFGFPKQERWIIEHKDEIPATVIMAVGGSFDFISGKVRRSPRFFQALGLEWLFRLILQPWRFWRQLRLLRFSALILREALVSRLKLPKTQN